MSGVTTLTHVPSFGGQASSAANYEEQVALRNRIRPSDPRRRAADLFLHVSDVARKVCATAGKDAIDNNDGVQRILRILRERFAPDAIDSVFQDIAKFMYFGGPRKI